MSGVLAAPFAKFLKLQFSLNRLFVFSFIVINPLAVCATQTNQLFLNFRFGHKN
jgi:hypothetical protein